MKNLLLKSYSKINICLNVVGKRQDGYHELDMIMLPLELHDSILFTELKNAKDHFVTIDDFSLGLFKYNIATAAIEKMQSLYHFDNKFRITIHKVIPMQSGLGGGSSNAGTVINAVNTYLKLNLPYEELIKISTGLGADTVEYAIEHLKVKRIVVLGHTHCGAVHATIKKEQGKYLNPILMRIRTNIGDIDNELEASKINAIKEAKYIKEKFPNYEGTIESKIYDIETSIVC